MVRSVSFFPSWVMPQETKQVIAPCILVIKLNLCDSKTKRGEQKNVSFILTCNQEAKDHSMVNKEAFDLIKRKETVGNLLAITRGKIF